ncbi:redox-active disulfide protein 2 [Spirosoma pollinicola]|uniref:Redox-active disulfide protein 2 n=1 Tax=Spirosoma pollinicola TaxID=2057025 RepID=A0A2K8YZ80_9BACT|nr:redox-active disulfide protein 2 [Spirosoma pollinicola]AUD02911.1 redox-active disulfide protein 2 [Spirosoma pollinicola]
MKNQKIQEMSNEALLKRKKTTGFVTGILSGMLIAGVTLSIFLWVKQGSSVALPLLVTFLALSSIVWININDLHSVKKELQIRNAEH